MPEHELNLTVETTKLSNLPTLFGVSVKGKTKTWSIGTVAEPTGEVYNRIEHGYLDGKKQVDVTHYTAGKNIGKTNETTPFNQALKEAKSLWKKKLDKGYALDLASANKSKDSIFLPMLAHRFDKHASKIKYPAYVQPKLDGVRCLAKKLNGDVVLWSRSGKVFDTPSLIKDQLTKTLLEGQCLDGELYVHGWDFQRIIRAVKKYRDDTDLLEYHIYDVPARSSMGFEGRFIQRNESILGEAIKIVPTHLTANLDELNSYEEKYVSLGFEGIVVRNADGPYKFKHRSYDLQKVKRFEDAEFTITGGKEGVGRAKGQVIFTCINEDSLEFDVRPTGTDEVRKNMWTKLDEYIGQQLTVKFQGRTLDNLPRFPVGLNIRPDWD